MIELLNMDCMDYLRDCPDKSFNMTVTSPPYGTLRDYGAGFSFTMDKCKSIIKELYRVTKDGGVVAWVVADQVVDGSESGDSFTQALYAKECGFRLSDTIIWFKGGVRFPDNTRYFDAFEYIFILSKGSPDYFNPITDRRNKWAGTNNHGTERQKTGETKQSKGAKEIPEISKRFNVWEIPNPGIAGTLHPATFPVKLAYDLIASWCPKNGVVLDPFCGSGTTGVAAHYFGCDFVGTEINPDYFAAAQARFDNETRQVALL